MGLTRIISGETVKISEQDAPVLDSYKWNILEARGKRYVYRTEGRGSNIYLHRQLMGFPENLEVDHEDGDSLNNTRENLRIATHQQNVANQNISKANTTGYKGVTLDRRRTKSGNVVSPTWEAQTKWRGKKVYLGKFSSPEDAARAYDRKMVELHGAFAKTNEALGLLPPDDGGTVTPNRHLGGIASRRHHASTQAQRLTKD